MTRPVGQRPSIGQSVSRRAGTGDGGPLVVLLHGSMDRGASMARVAAELADLDSVRYDRRGYGRSVEAGACGIDGHVEDLCHVVGERPSVLVGHSYGGVVALAAAARRPDLVLAVAAYEAPMPWCDWWPSTTAGGAAARSEDGRAAAEGFLRRMLGDERYERLPESTRAKRGREGDALVTELRSVRSGGAPYDPRALVVPVVAARGTRSGAHLRRAAEVLAAEVPGGELVVLEGADHGAHLSQPAAFATLVVRRAVALAAGDG